MLIETRSELGEAAIIHRAHEYFGGELGMSAETETTTAVSFSGEQGVVSISVDEDGPDSNVQVVTEGLEGKARQFLATIAGAAG
ncbi:MAG: hypothetical protein M3281_08865 [Chloroflexota bacterium]|nr:hypothetical protein [Chloroflexota bacterium]